jgi:hypothetical protein
VSAPGKSASLLKLHLGVDLARSLAREARRRRKTKSEVAREILSASLLGAGTPDPVEARRQSLLVSRRRSEKQTLDFLESAADVRGWR